MRTMMSIHLPARRVRGQSELLEVYAEPADRDDEWVVNELSRFVPFVPGDRLRVDSAGTVEDIVQPSNLGLVVMMTDVPLERRQAEGVIPAATALDVEATTLAILEQIRPLVRYVDYVASLIYAVPVNAAAVLALDDNPLLAGQCDVIRYPNGMVHERPLSIRDQGPLVPITMDWIRSYVNLEMPSDPAEQAAWERSREYGNKPPTEWLEDEG